MLCFQERNKRNGFFSLTFKKKIQSPVMPWLSMYRKPLFGCRQSISFKKSLTMLLRHFHYAWKMWHDFIAWLVNNGGITDIVSSGCWSFWNLEFFTAILGPHCGKITKCSANICKLKYSSVRGSFIPNEKIIYWLLLNAEQNHFKKQSFFDDKGVLLICTSLSKCGSKQETLGSVLNQ